MRKLHLNRKIIKSDTWILLIYKMVCARTVPGRRGTNCGNCCF